MNNLPGVRQLILIRHGQTEDNLIGRFQGQIDSPLNEDGERQAQAVAQALFGARLTAIYSSDLSRAYDTARAIADYHSMEVVAQPDLREAHLGAMQGQLRADVGELFGDDASVYRRMDVHSAPPGGESPMDLRRRCQRFWRGLQKDARSLPPGDVVIVAHGGTLRALLAVVLGFPVTGGWAFEFDNCSLTTVRLSESGRPVLVSYNDSSHVRREQALLPARGD